MKQPIDHELLNRYKEDREDTSVSARLTATTDNNVNNYEDVILQNHRRHRVVAGSAITADQSYRTSARIARTFRAEAAL